MNEIHYLISDASKKVDVEAHVLRYWEEELKLDIPRNEMGHRYYTEVHIRLFRQVKALKEKGYQLKAIKSALDRIIESGKDLIISDEVLEEDMEKALKKYSKAFEMNEEAKLLVKKKEEFTDERLANVAKKKRAIIKDTVPRFV